MFDYLVVGAGPSGLCAAKTIVECEVGASLKILDANKTLGGVWAKENIYPGLKTNNLRGGIDFSDFPMHDGFGIAAGEHVSGAVMHEYLVAYAERSDLVKLIDFETHVQEISQLQNGQGWNLKVRRCDSAAVGSNGAGSTTTEIQTKKLIIATGITNQPNRPFLIGTAAFEGPIVHSSEMGMKADALMDDPKIKRIAVIGGGKSAFDAVHLAGIKEKFVEWIMRKSGKGPEWVFPAHAQIGPFKLIRERLATRRILTFFSPCLWNDGFGWIRNKLHFTKLGRLLTQKFWANLHEKTLQQCRLMEFPYTRILQPETSPFWYGTASGILSYEPSLYDMIGGATVEIHREDISYLSKHSIMLTNGYTIQADAIITATGFSVEPTFKFLPTKLHSDLGIPTPSLTPEQHDFWKALDRQADLTIASSFPRLLDGPYKSPSSTVVQPYHGGMDANRRDHTPFRLYRAIAPPGLTAQGDRSLVFIGMFSNLANTPRCELQCLWAYAYLTGKLDQSNSIDPNTVFEETALMSRYVRHRAPYGHGKFFPDLVFDQLPYFDMLLQDLKLKYWRKGNLLAEIFGSYVSEDYAVVVQEWLKANKDDKVKED
ncbi:hypothetical protein A1O1_07241 [Capronia coronata CBS 617.96]|uniref:Uncharacterized protein n=1 Tax=Capronia coronata CBS 617.96 TaxID=1182541 RepID=W9XTQ1_9EURO|nr:uncharacterized protein A1O1_07241 [Capronia coronata CBS 617.96]EXJ83618.1 hypothetical protein A1O1_07241 [Capronia coronata CBS 617.96]